MSSMSVSLSDQLRGFIKSRVQSGDYHNESDPPPINESISRVNLVMF